MERCLRVVFVVIVILTLQEVGLLCVLGGLVFSLAAVGERDKSVFSGFFLVGNHECER